jgi:transcriptional regulator with XRE-family HTH domain
LQKSDNLPILYADTYDRMLISKSIRLALTQKGWSVKELASHSKVNKRTIEKWLGEEQTEPKVLAFARVANALGVSVESLVSGEEAGGGEVLTDKERDWLDIYRITPPSERAFLAQQARMIAEYERDREAEKNKLWRSI